MGKPIVAQHLPSLIATIVLAILAVAGNVFHLPLYFGVDFLFGSIFTFITLRLLGLKSGLIVALCEGAFTVVLWGHPYALIVKLAQTAFIGYMLRQQSARNIPGWTLVFWSAGGLLFVVLSYHLALNMSWDSSAMAAVKQAVNEVFNALLATLAIHYLPVKWFRKNPKLRQFDVYHLQINLVVGFALLSALIVIQVNAQFDARNTEKTIKQNITNSSKNLATQIADWQTKHMKVLETLTTRFSTITTHDLQLLQSYYPDFLVIHKVGTDGKIHLTSQADLKFPSKTGYTDREWFQRLVATKQPVVSNALIGRTTGKIVVATVIPAIVKEQLNGMIVGTIKSDILLHEIATRSKSIDSNIILVDGHGKIIASSDSSLLPLQNYQMVRGGKIIDHDGPISRWLPSHSKSAMQAWSDSIYFINIKDGMGGWQLIIEQPLRLYAEALQHEYLISFTAIYILAILAYVLGSRLVRVVSDPLYKLSEVTAGLVNNIASSAEPHLPSSNVTEIASLTQNFSNMARQLRVNYQELARARDNLEQRVADRTAELQQQQHALEIYKERLRLGQMYANIGIWDWNIQTGELFWTERIAPLFGYPSGELETSYENFLKAVHPDDRQAVIDAVNASVTRDVPYEIEHRVVWPDGTVKWLLERGAVRRNAEDKPVQMLGVVQDIDQRKHAELKLAERESFLNTLVNILPGMVGYWNKDLRCSFSNKHYLEWFGRTPEQMRNIRIQELLGEELYKRNEPYIHGALNGEPQHFERTLIKADGTSGYTWAHYIPDIQEGKVQGFYVLITDITEIKLAHTRLEEVNAELKSARDAAERANLTKSEFLSSMSHELRTPMNAILGFGQLLELDAALPSNDKDYVREILKAGKHLLELINEVLDLSKVEAGKVTLSLEPVELSPLIQECFNLMQPLADSRQIELALLGLQDAVVRADRFRLKQALINLLSNAIKYNRVGGRVTIELKTLGNNLVRLTVIDTGPGIAPERLPGLFIPFNRLGAEHTDIEGTGIGLTITKRIIELMGGEVNVRSELGVGSQFWIDMPLESFAKQHHLEKEIQKTSSVTPQETAQRLVLYIEDNPANLKLVTELLSHRKYIHLLTAHTSHLGIELAVKRKPELILLDINLAGLDGYQVLKALRANPELNKVPIVAITANAMPGDIKKGKAAGFSEYLTKPLDIAQFYAVIDQFLNIKP